MSKLLSPLYNFIYLPTMEKKQCLNCKTYFEEGDKLPLQGISIELKNFSIPIKEQKHKWILLETICALLNSKGGSIFIGAEDQTGEVIGSVLKRRQQDDFQLFIQQLISRLNPKVDLYDKEEVIVRFLPILRKEKFTGKYLIKIAVSQGDPRKLYCFTQKLSLMSADKKADEFEIVYACKRLNMGRVERIKGMDLVNEAVEKATSPIKLHKTFHEDCNPEPPNLSVEILKIAFSNIRDKETRKMLETWFKIYLQEMSVEPLIEYDPQNDMVVVELQSKEEFTKVYNFIDKNIDQLNKSLQKCKFIKGTEFLDCMVFKNTVQMQIPKQTPKKHVVKHFKEVEEPPQVKKEQAEKKVDKPAPKKKQEQKGNRSHCLTFTHILPQSKIQFMNYLEHNIMKCPKQFATQYENTIEVFFQSEDDLTNFYVSCLQKDQQMYRFGFKDTLMFGENLGLLEVCYYDKNRWRDFEKYLQKTMGKQLLSIERVKKGNHYSLALHMAHKKLACQWLDKLLKSKQFKSFSIPGDKNKVPKMKTYLKVEAYDVELEEFLL